MYQHHQLCPRMPRRLVSLLAFPLWRSLPAASPFTTAAKFLICGKPDRVASGPSPRDKGPRRIQEARRVAILSRRSRAPQTTRTKRIMATPEKVTIRRMPLRVRPVAAQPARIQNVLQSILCTNPDRWFDWPLRHVYESIRLSFILIFRTVSPFWTCRPHFFSTHSSHRKGHHLILRRHSSRNACTPLQTLRPCLAAKVSRFARPLGRQDFISPRCRPLAHKDQYG